MGKTTWDYFQEMRDKEDEYLRLRDAKSDGCCHGMNPFEVAEYDAKIMCAYNAFLDAREKWVASTLGARV